MNKILLLAFFLVAPLLVVSAQEMELGPGEVVALVGGTDMVRMQDEGRLEAALTHHFRKEAPLFRDLAWEGDTVFFQSTVQARWRREAFGDWAQQLERVKATVVIVQFGKIESLDGVEKVEAFVNAYGELLDVLAGNERRVIVLGPFPFEWPEVAAAAWPAYGEAVAHLAGERGMMFVEADRTDPVGGVIRGLTGVVEPDRAGEEPLREGVREKHRLWREYWRPTNWKCLFGDDSRRVFSKASHGLPSIQEEWASYPALIAAAEEAIRNGERWVRPGAPERTGAKVADIAQELADFEVLEGFEVNLFADESDGIANPLSVRWDASGRMYVACSDVYPQIEPGVRGNDKVIALRDHDRDGRADESVVFAEGLSIPTGMEVGPERVYIGQGTELLTLRDTDGDGVADERVVLLRGFGNGDSHQTSNSFVWSPGGELWWCQGDGIESRVETPFGVSSLFQAGVFRLRPGELRLDGLLDDFMGPGNPWGVVFDDFGQSFVIDGAGGVSYLTPGSIPAKRRLKLPRIGAPGGYCGIDCLGASTFPDALQGQFVIGDYKKNQVSRFETVEDGAGFKLEWRSPLLRSKHRNFRPIDVKVGPDGAIYVVDWYNPITCHQDDFYRHPERDKTHGRIWRIAPKSGALRPPVLVSAEISELLGALKSPERWTRQKAKQVLALRDAGEVLPAVERWVRGEQGHGESRRLLEAAAVLEWIERPDERMVRVLLESPDHRARAYGARLAGRWGLRLENVHELLLRAARDPHPRVRMEAALACAEIPEARSVLIAAAVAELPRDGWIDYAFSQAVHHLKETWLPSFRRGELDFGGQRRGLAAVLGEAGVKGVVEEVRKLLRSGEVDHEARLALINALIALGEESDLSEMLAWDQPEVVALRGLARRERPAIDVVRPLERALRHRDVAVQVAAAELIGAWRVVSLHDAMVERARDARADVGLRFAAVRSLGLIGNGKTVEILMGMAGTAGPMRSAVVAALLDLDVASGVATAAAILATAEGPGPITTLFRDLARHAGAPRLLAQELGRMELDVAQAQRLLRSWMTAGLIDEELSRVLQDLAGVERKGLSFGETVVAEMVEAGRAGERGRGEAIFWSEQSGCAACHTIGGKGGAIGPDLSAVGSAVLPERIVTEVLWPARQVKEGYALTRVTTKKGQVMQGYVQAGRNEELLLLRDFADGRLHEIPVAEIGGRDEVGTLMPPTAQGLTREQLGDLFAYLFSLDGS